MNWYKIGNLLRLPFIVSQPQPSNKCLITTLLLVLLLFPVSSQADYCVNIQAGFATKCTICEYTTGFQNCRVRIIGEPGFNVNQTQCFSTCCSSTDNNTKALRLCTNSYLNNQTSSVSSSSGLSTAEVFIIICVTVPILFCICLLVSRYLRKRRQAAGQQANSPQTAVNLEAYDINAFGPYFLDSKQACSICLDASCNIITRCGHIYHAHCLALWINKTRKCPLCITPDFNPTLKYCHTCHRPVQIFILQPISNSPNRGEQCQEVKCRGCSSNQQEIVIQSCEDMENVGNRSRDQPIQVQQSVQKIGAN